MINQVGAAGFEPATLCSQSRYANRTALCPVAFLIFDLVIFDLLNQKFNEPNFIKNLLFSLSYFVDAENDALPLAFVDYSWEEIKTFFISYQASLAKLLK